jgi:hypothetical protein
MREGFAMREKAVGEHPKNAQRNSGPPARFPPLIQIDAGSGAQISKAKKASPNSQPTPCPSQKLKKPN